MTIAIEIEKLSKTYLIYDKPLDRLKQSILRNKKYYREFQALKEINLTINRGESLGIIGRNGSGKSTLLQLICGTIAQTTGDVKVNGRISALLELGAGFNPEFSGKENIYLNASILGLSKEETDEKYEGIVVFANIGDHLNQPVKTYSSGMYIRLAFAVAVATDPEILIVDEALAVGDISFQRKCFARIREMQENGATILFVSHSAGTVMDICNRAILLDGGELIMEGEPKKLISSYQRLMFAPAEKAPAIREEIKSGIAHEEEKEVIYDPYMKPESTIEYESRGAIISNVNISDLEGKATNIMNRGDEYIYSYDVTFQEDAQSVRFGMIIKTNSGIELGGATTHIDKEADLNMTSDEKRTVSFHFKCMLGEGAYFTNAGCSAVIDGERIHLHRIMDAVMFRVKEEGETKETGIVDFGISSKIENYKE